MPRTVERKQGAYYDLNREARLQYQRERYARLRDTLKRTRDLNRVLDEERHERYLAYQREYYVRNRERLRAQRKQHRKQKQEAARATRRAL